MMKRWWRVKKRPSGSTRATVRSSGQRSRSSERKWDLLCWYLELFTFCFVDIWNYSQFALLIFGIIHIFTSLYPCNVHVVKLFSCSRWKRSGVSFLNSNSPPSEFGRPQNWFLEILGILSHPKMLHALLLMNKLTLDKGKRLALVFPKPKMWSLYVHWLRGIFGEKQHLALNFTIFSKRKSCLFLGLYFSSQECGRANVRFIMELKKFPNWKITCFSYQNPDKTWKKWEQRISLLLFVSKSR